MSLSGGRCDLPTSLARVTIDSAGQASYRFEREAVADRSLAPLDLLKDWPVQARFFHVGSLALIPPDGEKWCELLGALNRRGVTTSVDINMRTMATADAPGYVATARAAAAQATWLKLSDDDLLALGLVEEPVAAARHLLGAVTKVVLLTLGAQGAWCLTQDEEMFEPAPCVEVLDTVGAGDCFYAGFLASLDEQQVLHMLPSAPKLRQAMALGTQAAAFSLQQRGCQPAWRREL